MVTLEWDCERTDGVTLVRAYVTADRPHRVRLENCLDGPVWPPRRRGQVAAGWDEDGFEGVVTPGERLVAGYATPARPADPPVTLARSDPVTGGYPGENGASPTPRADEPATPAGVVRSLGDPTVPRDAVPVPEGDRTGAVAPDQNRTSTPAADRDVAPAAEGPSSSVDGADAGDRPVAETEPATDGDAPPLVPGPVRAWLADVQRRALAAEASSGEGALAAAVAVDREALARVARRVETLRGQTGGERTADPHEATHDR